MTDFNNRIGVRLGERESQAIDEAIVEDPDRYNDRSHFVRCCIIACLNDKNLLNNLFGNQEVDFKNTQVYKGEE